MSPINRTLQDIAEKVGGRVIGEGTTPVSRPSSPEKAVPGEICTLWNSRECGKIGHGTLLMASPDIFALFPGLQGVEVEDPRAAFPLLLSMFQQPKHAGGMIHPSAVVSAGADVSPTAWVGPMCVVEENAVIEKGAYLQAQVYVGYDCRVGEGTVIEPGTVLLRSVRTGRNCLIHSGAVLGCDGFGILPAEQGKAPVKIPQLGGVLLGDEVEVGACTTIDRGTLEDTILGSFTKIDDHVHIAHNAVIGENCILVAMTGIAGSAVLEDNVVMAARSGARDHIRVGRGATVAANGGATKNVPPGAVVSGFPARDHREDFRIQASMRRLPDLLSRVKKLETLLEDLSSPHGSIKKTEKTDEGTR